MRYLDQFQPVYDTKLLVGHKNSIGQTFTAKHDNLAGIRLSISNANLGGKRLYHILIADNFGLVRNERVTESNIGWNTNFRFDFKPILNSKDVTYTIKIQAEDSINESLTTSLTIFNLQKAKNGKDTNKLSLEEISNLEKRFLNVSYSLRDVYPFGQAKLEEENLAGDMVFETYYQTTILSGIKDSLFRTAQRLFIDKTFLIFYLLIIFSLCIAILTPFVIKPRQRLRPDK